MFNLLPQSEQKSIKAEYSRRRILVTLLFLLGTIVIALVFLIPSIVIAHYRLSEVTQADESLKSNSLIQNQQQLKSNISVANKKIATLSEVPLQNVAETLSAISSQKTSDITLTSFTFAQTSPTSTEITVKGNAASRENLLTFVSDLEKSGAYSSVNLPISNFAKDTDIDFSLTITSGS